MYSITKKLTTEEVSELLVKRGYKPVSQVGNTTTYEGSKDFGMLPLLALFVLGGIPGFIYYLFICRNKQIIFMEGKEDSTLTALTRRAEDDLVAIKNG